MQLSTYILGSVVAQGTLGAATKLGPLDGATFIPMSRKIEVSPGQIHTLNGAIEQAIAQAIAINTNYTLPELTPCPGTNLKLHSPSWKHGELKPCNSELPYALTKSIIETLNPLCRIGGGPILPGAENRGDRVCTWVSCSYPSSSIYICNLVCVCLNSDSSDVKFMTNVLYRTNFPWRHWGLPRMMLRTAQPTS